MKVFISYRREDSAGHAGRLHDSLQSHFGADNVFMDLSDIDSGTNFGDAIQTAITTSDVVLAVIGTQWLTCSSAGKRRLDMPNDFVRTEIGMALQHGVPVIPVLVQGASVPLAPSLPEPIKRLASHDAHDLSDERWSYDVGRLIEATEKLGRKPLAGHWSADVTYDWGDKYTERFSFTVDGDTVIGSASFLGVRRGIVDGSLTGDRVVFHTRTEEITGDKPSSVVHRYRGAITGDTIVFTMQTEGGSSSVPVEFTARRN